MLSIIVIFHNMQREAARTLVSLCATYQQNIRASDYEVIAVDNGSAAPLDGDWVRGLGPNFSYFFHETVSVSPVDAVNFGVVQARGDRVAVIVDGARLASPALVYWSLQASRLFPDALIGGLSWHLGPKVQNVSMLEGYTQAAEDALLDSIQWPLAGERLFEIATLAGSSNKGFLADVPTELSYFVLAREQFQTLGGFDTRFQSPGGGLVNHHFRDRALASGASAPVMLLGEGVFHQIHGGVATNVAPADHPFTAFAAEYEQITGTRYKVTPGPTPILLGHLPVAARRFVLCSGLQSNRMMRDKDVYVRD